LSGELQEVTTTAQWHPATPEQRKELVLLMEQLQLTCQSTLDQARTMFGEDDPKTGKAEDVRAAVVRLERELARESAVSAFA
jgi:hypothetical protein